MYFFLCVFDPACYEETKQEWDRTNLKHVFLNFALQGTPEHDCFQLILPISMLFFTIWMLTLDPVIIEHYWQSLEELSFAIVKIKNINLVVDFVHIFLLIFLNYQNLLFTTLCNYDYILNISIFSSFIPSLGCNNNLNSKITLYT